MRALVTGCAGFIGSHLVDSLLDGGTEVVGVDCFTETYARRQKVENLTAARQWERFKLVELNIAEADLRHVVEEADVVFHLAAEPGVRPSWGSGFEAYVQNNVLATHRLLEAVKDSPDTRFVYASSSSVYGQAERSATSESATPQPFSPYGVTKLAAEHLVRLYSANYGVDGVSLRYFTVYGPRQRPDMAFHRFCRAAIEGTPLTVFGDGSQVRDFTFVSDAVRGTRAAAGSPRASGGVYNIGGGSQVRLSTAIDLIGELVGQPLEIRYRPPQPGDVISTGASIEWAHRDLDYRPNVGLKVGLQAELEWLIGAAGISDPSFSLRSS
jgi:UDP-glucuronate 4-epimerase